jgi:hypothetical protein
MDEVAWVWDLDRRGAAGAVADARARLLRVEADRLVLAVHWADLHAEDATHADGETGSGRVLPGSERFKLVGGHGTPEVGEFAVAELALQMQVTVATAAAMMADGLDLRHRLPLAWAAVLEGGVEAWKARKVAARLRSVGLTREQARWVDTQVTPYLVSLPWSRLCDLLEAKIIEADPEAAEARRVAAAMDRFVRTGQSNEYGLSTILVRATAGDAVFFVAMCDRLAQILALEGDTDSVDVRRSKAADILADPARALAMLQRHAVVDPTGSPTGDPEAVDDPEDGARAPGAEAGVEAGAGAGQPEPGDQRLDLGGACDAASDTTPTTPGVPAPPGSPGSFGTHCGTCGATVGDPSAFVRPMRIDPAKLRPAATLYIHTSREAWDAARCGGAGGVARLESVGPVTLSQAVEMLRHTSVTVREVVDLAEDHPVDGYEVPDRMRELLLHRTPATAFPWGPRTRRGHDADHTVPYLSPGKGGPPDQTRIANLGFLNRGAHRVKTHASGWRHHQPEPGVHYWRTPTGSWFRVDHHGSHALGRDPTLPWETAQHPRRTRIETIWPHQTDSPYELALSDLLAG